MRPSVAMSRMRVAERVAHGGHNIPLTDIKRRFLRSLKNLLTEFAGITDYTRCFMNDGQISKLVFTQAGKARNILEPELFEQLRQGAGL